MALARGPGGAPPHSRRTQRLPAAEDRSAGGIPRLVLPGAGVLLRRARPRARSLLGAGGLLFRPQRRHRDRTTAQLQGAALLREPVRRTGGSGRRRRRLGVEGVSRLGPESRQPAARRRRLLRDGVPVHLSDGAAVAADLPGLRALV